MGGGQKRPGVLVHRLLVRRKIAQSLLRNRSIRRVAGFQSSAFAFLAPRLFRRYAEDLGPLFENDKALQWNFDNSIFPACGFNCGPQCVTIDHFDHANLSWGLCVVTPFGNFDYQKGGHLILHGLKKVVEFPSGTSAAFPSAILEHSNTPIQLGEERTSMTQFAAGGLFRWAAYGYQTSKKLSMTAKGRAFRDRVDGEEDRRWTEGISLYSTPLHDSRTASIPCQINRRVIIGLQIECYGPSIKANQVKVTELQCGHVCGRVWLTKVTAASSSPTVRADIIHNPSESDWVPSTIYKEVLGIAFHEVAEQAPHPPPSPTKPLFPTPSDSTPSPPPLAAKSSSGTGSEPAQAMTRAKAGTRSFSVPPPLEVLANLRTARQSAGNTLMLSRGGATSTHDLSQGGLPAFEPEVKQDFPARAFHRPQLLPRGLQEQLELHLKSAQGKTHRLHNFDKVLTGILHKPPHCIDLLRTFAHHCIFTHREYPGPRLQQDPCMASTRQRPASSPLPTRDLAPPLLQPVLNIVGTSLGLTNGLALLDSPYDKIPRLQPPDWVMDIWIVPIDTTTGPDADARRLSFVSAHFAMP
ncbi:hypothetical protein NMY22_g17687 [Coprinellus aureogranulatus]|nr:hypothetical protein NMY22_g17687 [Coprinellus aureogranulatus]